MNCSGCNNTLSSGAQFMLCRSCKEKYHYECLNIQPSHFLSLAPEVKANWICPSCANITRRVRSNPDTPVRTSLASTLDESCFNIPPSDISMNTSSDNTESGAFSVNAEDNVQNLKHTQLNYDIAKLVVDIQSTLNNWRAEMHQSIAKLGDNINSSLADIKNEIQTIRVENSNIKNKMGELTKSISELQSTAEFHASNHIDLKKRVDELTVMNNKSNINKNIVDSLETKVDMLEQQSRQCNLEICNLPEKRNENLLLILESIGSAIGCSIAQRDIISIHRVRHAHQHNNKPKNVIAKLISRTLRDNVLSAFRLAKGLKSDRLGIAGPSVSIYLNEHMTLKRKQLFRECREAAKRSNFKYVWVKNATILARQADNAPVIAIRSIEDVNKIRSCSNLKHKQTQGGTT